MSQEEVRQEVASSTARRVIYQIGFWSAILIGASPLFPFILLAFAPAPVFIAADTGVSFLIPLAFIALMVSISNYASPMKRNWSRLGLVCGILYACCTYFELIAVLVLLRSSEWAILHLPSPTEYRALQALRFAFWGLAGLFAVPVFHKVGIERAIRWCLAINGLFTAISALDYVLSSEPTNWLATPGYAARAIVFPIAAALLAVVFKRAERIQRQWAQ